MNRTKAVGIPLFVALAFLLKYRPSGCPGDQPAASVQPRVIAVEGNLELDDLIRVEVDHLSEWAAAKNDPAKLVPYLNGLAIRGNRFQIPRTEISCRIAGCEDLSNAAPTGFVAKPPSVHRPSGSDCLDSLSFIEFMAPFTWSTATTPLGLRGSSLLFPKVAEYSNLGLWAATTTSL